MGTSTIRSEISWYMESRGRCFAELTARWSNEVRCIALKEQRRRKQGSSADQQGSQVGRELGIRAVAGLYWEGAQTNRGPADQRRCLHREAMGCKEASQSSAPIVVVWKQLVVY